MSKIKSENILKALKIIAFMCAPITVVLAILWILYPINYIEPITVALGAISIILYAAVDLLEKRRQQSLSNKKISNQPSIEDILCIVEKSKESDWNVSFSNGEIAVLKNNPNIRIENKNSQEYVHNNEFYEEWANKFSDPHAVSYYYYLYYGSTLVKEFILVGVDGNRALLPLPQSTVNLRVDPLRYRVAKIFDQLGTCDDYMRRAKLYVK